MTTPAINQQYGQATLQEMVLFKNDNIITPLVILMIKGSLWGYQFYQKAGWWCWFRIILRDMRRDTWYVMLTKITKLQKLVLKGKVLYVTSKSLYVSLNITPIYIHNQQALKTTIMFHRMKKGTFKQFIFLRRVNLNKIC